MKKPDHCPVFVYGSLRRGEIFNGLIAPYAYDFKPATLYGMQMYSLGEFPAIVFDETATTPVVGELVYIFKEWWAEAVERLDRLESEGVLYNRTLVIVMCEGKAQTAWTYVLNREVISLDEITRMVTNDWKLKEAGDAEYRRRVII